MNKKKRFIIVIGESEMEKNIDIYRINSDISCRIEGNDEIILYNPDIDDLIIINSSALEIWRFLETSHSVDEICAHLVRLFNEHPEEEVLLQDVMSFLDKLGEGYICKEKRHEY